MDKTRPDRGEEFERESVHPGLKDLWENKGFQFLLSSLGPVSVPDSVPVPGPDLDPVPESELPGLTPF